MPEPTPEEAYSTERTQLERKPRGSDKEKHAKFRELYIEYAMRDWPTYNDMLKATLHDAGFTQNDNTGVIYKARQVLTKNWPEIQQEIGKKLNFGAVIAAETLIELTKYGKQESVRLKAATELLNKAGFQEAQKLEVTQRPLEEMSEEDLDNKIKELLDQEQEEGNIVIIPAESETSIASTEDTKEV